VGPGSALTRTLHCQSGHRAWAPSARAAISSLAMAWLGPCCAAVRSMVVQSKLTLSEARSQRAAGGVDADLSRGEEGGTRAFASSDRHMVEDVGENLQIEQRISHGVADGVFACDDADGVERHALERGTVTRAVVAPHR